MTTTANTLTLSTSRKSTCASTPPGVGDGGEVHVDGQGQSRRSTLTIGSGANPTVSDTSAVVPVTAPAVGTGFDSTIANILDFWVGFSINNAGNGVQVYDYTVEQLQ